MRYALMCLTVTCVVGCGGAKPVDLAGPMTVDELKAAWVTRAGEVRDRDGKPISVSGQMGTSFDRVFGLMSEKNPELEIRCVATEPVEAKTHARVAVDGKLKVGGGGYSIVDAVIKTRP